MASRLLGNHQHRLWILLSIAGYTAREIAAMAGVHYNTVHNTKSRMNKKGLLVPMAQELLAQRDTIIWDGIKESAKGILLKARDHAATRLVAHIDAESERISLRACETVLALNGMVSPTAGSSDMEKAPPQLVINWGGTMNINSPGGEISQDPVGVPTEAEIISETSPANEITFSETIPVSPSTWADSINQGDSNGKGNSNSQESTWRDGCHEHHLDDGGDTRNS